MLRKLLRRNLISQNHEADSLPNLYGIYQNSASSIGVALLSSSDSIPNKAHHKNVHDLKVVPELLDARAISLSILLGSWNCIRGQVAVLRHHVRNSHSDRETG